MENFETQLKRLGEMGREIKLTENERISMRAKLESLPLTNNIATPKLSPYVSKFSFAHLLHATAYVFIGMIVGTTGLGFVSAQALPGDALYPVKTNIIEQVKGVFITNPDQRLAYEQSLTRARIHEIKTLQNKSTVSDKQAVIAINAFTKQTAKVEASITSLEQNGEIEKANAARKTLLDQLADQTKAIQPQPTHTGEIQNNNGKVFIAYQIQLEKNRLNTTSTILRTHESDQAGTMVAMSKTITPATENSNTPTISQPTKVMATTFALPKESTLRGVLSLKTKCDDHRPECEAIQKLISNYTILIIDPKTKEEIAKTTFAEDGSYNVTLRPGTYIVRIVDKKNIVKQKEKTITIPEERETVLNLDLEQ